MKIELILTVLFLFFSTPIIYAYPVNISGKVNFSQIKEISINRFDFENQETVFLKKCKITDNGSFLLNFEIEKPQLVSILNNSIFISPNDKVRIEFNSISNFSVTGKNSGNYIFFSTIKNIDLPNFKNGIYANDLTKYKYDLKSHFNEINEIFTDFQRNNNVSKQFIGFVEKELRVQYLLNLLVPHATTTLKKDEFPISYLEEIRLKELNLDFFISNNYQNFLYFYSSYLSNKPFTDPKKSLICINMASTHFKGRGKDFVKYFYFRTITLRQSLSDKNLIDSLYSAIKLSTKNDYYLSRINKSYDNYELNNKPFPLHVLSIDLYNFDNKKISLDSLLNQEKGKILLIDFWAKWCGGCITEFPFSKKLESSFEKLNVIPLNFSIDDDLQTWHNSISKYELNPVYQYFLEKKSAEVLFEYLKIKSIPRYVIIDKKGYMSIMDAPRPQSATILLNVLSEISNKSKY